MTGIWVKRVFVEYQRATEHRRKWTSNTHIITRCVHVTCTDDLMNPYLKRSMSFIPATLLWHQNLYTRQFLQATSCGYLLRVFGWGGVSFMQAMATTLGAASGVAIGDYVSCHFFVTCRSFTLTLVQPRRVKVRRLPQYQNMQRNLYFPTKRCN